MKVIKSRNNRQQETFKGSLNACKAYISGIIEQLSDGNLSPWISLEYSETKVIYTNDNNTTVWEVVK